jgi:hypothetical protein
MAGDIREDIHGILEQHHTRYEVRPYYVVVDQRPVGAPSIVQRVQAGFDVDLYSTVEKEQFPLFQSEPARMVVDHFKAAAQEIQLKVGNHCTVEVVPDENSTVFDTREHLRPEAMLRIRIGHLRGQDQPAGPSEEQAVSAIREVLRNLKVPEA